MVCPQQKEQAIQSAFQDIVWENASTLFEACKTRDNLPYHRCDHEATSPGRLTAQSLADDCGFRFTKDLL